MILPKKTKKSLSAGTVFCMHCKFCVQKYNDIFLTEGQLHKEFTRANSLGTKTIIAIAAVT